MENFGDWLLNKLDEKGMTQSELARRSRLSEGTISNIISSSRGTGLDSIEAIAYALRIPPEEVFLAAIGKPLKPDEEWVRETAHKIASLPPNLRSIADDLIDAMLRREEAETPKPKQKPRSAKAWEKKSYPVSDPIGVG
jgi:transcriptional regulator with XRE-family HTH domain